MMATSAVCQVVAFQRHPRWKGTSSNNFFKFNIKVNQNSFPLRPTNFSWLNGKFLWPKSDVKWVKIRGKSRVWKRSIHVHDKIIDFFLTMPKFVFSCQFSFFIKIPDFYLLKCNSKEPAIWQFFIFFLTITKFYFPANSFFFLNSDF